MWRHFFPCVLVSVAFVGFAACDPDLTPVKAGAATDGGKEGSGPGPGGEDDGSAPAEDGGVDASTDDAQGPSSHKVDGVDDFKAEEKLPTSSLGNGYEAFITWDAKNVYFGMAGADIGRPASEGKWVLLYIEGANGTTSGINYNGQQPTLPFSALYHLGFKTDLSFTNKSRWDGGQWVDAGIALNPTAAIGTTLMEFSIPRTAIGNPARLKVHLSMLVEATGSQWNYAAVPSTSFTDGPSRNFTKYFDFDLADTTKAPNTYAPLP
jgi:hypothetical protein